MRSREKAVLAALRLPTQPRVVVEESLDELGRLAESAGRAIVTVPRSDEARFTDVCTSRELPHTRIGVVDVLTGDLEVQDQFTAPLSELRAAWSAPLRTLFGA